MIHSRHQSMKTFLAISLSLSCLAAGAARGGGAVRTNAGPDPGRIYASPAGSPRGNGTKASPYDYSTAIPKARVNKPVYFMDGIYVTGKAEQVTFGGAGGRPARYYADDGARPIFTRADGHPPRVYLNASTRVEGLWFGGPRKRSSEGEGDETFILNGNGDTLRQCVLWNYFDGLGSSSKKLLIEDNLFANCGAEKFWHSIYLTGRPGGWDSALVVRRNTFVGDTANSSYAIHFWHRPRYCRVERNFVGKVGHASAWDNPTDTLYFRDNVIWWTGTTHSAAEGHRQPVLSFDGGIETVRHNLFGRNTPYWRLGVGGSTADSDYYETNAWKVETPRGNDHHAVRFEEANTASVLGIDARTIYDAIAAIERALMPGVSVETVLVDTTIVANWRTLIGTVDHFSGYTDEVVGSVRAGSSAAKGSPGKKK